MAQAIETESLTTHPLDPPTTSEIQTAAQVVKTIAPDFVFATVALNEPDKASVAAGTTAREIVVVGLDRQVGTKRFVVDVEDEAIRSSETVTGGQAPINFRDVAKVIGITKSDPGWLAAMKARGITDIENVQIDPWPTGGFVHPSVPKGHRAMRAISFVREFKEDNGYARPVQGLIAHVDITAGEVAHLEDHGIVDLPPEHGRYDAASQPTLREAPKPIAITQDEGVSFEVDGYAVRWQKWQFRVSMHPIHGLVLHQLGIEDGDRVRPILYRASLSDMVVPYGDPDPMHHWKHVFDASEASIGTIPNSLTLGCDCLGEIHYFDIDIVNYKGEPRRIENAICMHEEDYGILWKHYDAATQKQEVRRSRRFVISAIHTVGNYEYGFFWYLYLDGTIQMEVKLTGIVGVSAVAAGRERQEFAPLIAPGLASPVHQHLFNFRLDFDLDGVANRVYEVNTEALAADHPDNPHGTGFATVATLLEREHNAKRDIEPRTGRVWKVAAPDRVNRMGQPVAYKLMPSATPVLLASPDSAVGQRAGFGRHNLWVTPFEADEMSAAGDQTNLHPGGAGLPAWTAGNRSIVDEDLVVWHTVGVTHVPRPEDWPVMPVEYCGFMLQPVGFFERNPALDLPGH